MVIHLIRHGITQGNQQRLYYGATDLPLCDEGIQALSALKAKGGYPNPQGHGLYTTGLLRTEQTFEGLFGTLPHQHLPALQEMNFGIFEMGSHETLVDDPQYQTWITGDFPNNVPPQGESATAFAKRVVVGFEALVDKGESAIVVAHGGTISAVMMHLFPQEEKTVYDWIPAPGHGYTLHLDAADASYDALPAPPYWAGKGYSFFQNTACEYFPCHQTAHPEDFNCLFCYCPLFALGEKCGGNFTYNAKGNKDCTHCLFPHQRQNYGAVLAKYPAIAALAKKEPPSNI